MKCQRERERVDFGFPSIPTTQAAVVIILIVSLFGSRILAADGKEWRFHKMKFEQGFPKVLSHESFLYPSRGFLVGD
ncbi:hypothetical protein NC652_017653 [Populus alba x Populus x berolinensis]|nr:hypothetical protein NC652_017653 [Populus alba x Populus x berolinensis]